MWGQNTTSCFSSSAALTRVMMFSTDRDLTNKTGAARHNKKQTNSQKVTKTSGGDE
jgi:hypothetical protein